MYKNKKLWSNLSTKPYISYEIFSKLFYVVHNNPGPHDRMP